MQNNQEGRRPRTKLKPEEILAAAKSVDARGERVTAESLRQELKGHGCNTVLTREARLFRLRKVSAMAGSELIGDLADPVLIGTNGKVAIFQVPVAIKLTPDIIKYLAGLEPGEADLPKAHVKLLLRREPLELLQGYLKNLSKAT